MKLPERANGLVILASVVAVGMGIPAFYRWKVTDLGHDRDEIMANAPSQPRARIELWFEILQPQLLGVVHSIRFSSAQPWLVSHVVRPRSAAEPPEVWGVPDAEVGVEDVVLDGLVVRLVLPAPTLVARDVLVGDNALGVEVYPPDAPPQDPRVLLRNRIEWVLRDMAQALEKEIDGACISVEVGGLVRPRAVAPATVPSTGAD